eukprot:1721227-Amphidinium_carterae.1
MEKSGINGTNALALGSFGAESELQKSSRPSLGLAFNRLHTATLSLSSSVLWLVQSRLILALHCLLKKKARQDQ